MRRRLLLFLIALLALPGALSVAPIAATAQDEGRAALLFSLVVEPEPPRTAPLHAGGLILRDAETGAFTPRASVTQAAPESAMLAPLSGLGQHQIGGLFLLEVPPGRYRPRQFDVQTEIGRGASGPICCPTSVEARAGEITYLGRITLSARGPNADAPIRAVTLTITDAANQDLALFRSVAPDSPTVRRAVAPHPPVTRYIGDGRFRE